jgi:hypothetical protein
MLRVLIGATAASLACFLTGPAAAQPFPTYAQPLGDTRLSGTVVQFQPGSFNLGLLDDRGFVDRIVLHIGTIILPIGIDLTTGMRVSIVGQNAGALFVANEIDRDDPLAEPPPAWYGRWVAPHAATAQNPPAPPIVHTPFP